MAQEGISPSAQGVILISADLVLFCVFTYLLRGWIRAIAVFITILILIHLLQLWAMAPVIRDSWNLPSQSQNRSAHTVSDCFAWWARNTTRWDSAKLANMPTSVPAAMPITG